MPQFKLLHLTNAKADVKILYCVSMATLYTSVILWLLSNSNRYLALSCILYILRQYSALHKCAFEKCMLAYVIAMYQLSFIFD